MEFLGQFRRERLREDEDGLPDPDDPWPEDVRPGGYLRHVLATED